jgi:hypothetical protein
VYLFLGLLQLPTNSLLDMLCDVPRVVFGVPDFMQVVPNRMLDGVFSDFERRRRVL